MSIGYDDDPLVFPSYKGSFMLRDETVLLTQTHGNLGHFGALNQFLEVIKSIDALIG